MFDEILAVVNFSEVATAVLAIAALIAVVLVVRQGARFVLSMLSDDEDPYDGTGPSGLDFRDLK